MIHEFTFANIPPVCQYAKSRRPGPATYLPAGRQVVKPRPVRAGLTTTHFADARFPNPHGLRLAQGAMRAGEQDWDTILYLRAAPNGMSQPPVHVLAVGDADNVDG